MTTSSSENSETNQSKTDAPQSVKHENPTTLGQYLTQARTKQSMSLLDMASALKLSKRQVNAIEEEDWLLLPSITYARGFARNYARLVHADNSEFNTLLDQALPPKLSLDIAESSGLSEAITDYRKEDGRNLALIGFSLFIILAAALGYYFLPSRDAINSDVAYNNTVPNADLLDNDTALFTEENYQPFTSLTVPVNTVETRTPLALENNDNTVNIPITNVTNLPEERTVTPKNTTIGDNFTAPVALTSTVNYDDVPANPASENNDQAVDDTTQSTAENTPDGTNNVEDADDDKATSEVDEEAIDAPTTLADGHVNIRFTVTKDEAWIEAKAADGSTLHRKLSQPGVYDVSGLAPIAITIGNPDAVTLYRNGEIIDKPNNNGVLRTKIN